MKNIFPTQYSTLSSSALAEFIESQYGLEELNCKLLVRNVSDVYILEGKNYKYIFKIYRDSYRNLDEIEGEVELLNILKENGSHLSYPIKDLAGKEVQHFQAAEGTRNGVLFSFAPGKVMWLDEDRLKILGREMAHMHNITSEIKLSHARPVYDTETTLTKPLETIKSTFKDLPEEYAFLKETAAKVIAKMEKTDTSGFSYGYCHYDFIPKNFHFDDNNKLTLFDFDFAGKGYLVNDLMTFYIHLFFHVSVGRMTQEKADEEFKILTDAYKQIRPLSQEELDTIPYLGFMFWVYFLGFYVDHFEDWSNTFLTLHFLKERVALMRKWVACYCVF